MNTDRRLRAWFLISVDPTQMRGVIDSIRGLDDKASDTRVVVRADIVEGDPFNLIVPIDFDASDDYYNQTLGAIETTEGVRGVQGYPVVQDGHNPAPPHSAEGFITDQEFESYPPPSGIKPGRQRNSPGFTPWG